MRKEQGTEACLAQEDFSCQLKGARKGQREGGAPKGETPRGEKEEGKGAKREKNVKGSL